MGTNFYYYETPPCDKCGHCCEPIHIGKSSAGWCFSLHVYPDKDIADLPDWQRLWTREGSFIQDEYNSPVSVNEMIERITERHFSGSWSTADLRENHAVVGPNGLACSMIDGRYCIGHGAGTWDLKVGEFS